MKSVFSEKDLTLCVVPVPKGCPQSQTHSGIAVYNGRVYLTTSPFPQVRYSGVRQLLRALLFKLSSGKLPIKHGDVDENPLLYWGENDTEAPLVFTPFIGNPFVSVPPSLFGFPSFNSDPDIFIENDNIYVINREYIRCTPPGSKHYLGDSLIRLDIVRFKAIEGGAKYVSSTIFKESYENILSPCLTKWDGNYRLLYLDTYSYLYPQADCKLYVETSETIDCQYGNKTEIKIDSENYVPWHLSVFWHEGRLYSIVACVKKGQPKRLYQMLGEFDENLSTLKIYQCPLIEIPSYRGSAYVSKHGDFILYSTTDKFPLKGSKSIDGKDVVMARMEFKKLLNEMRRSD